MLLCLVPASFCSENAVICVIFAKAFQFVSYDGWPTEKSFKKKNKPKTQWQLTHMQFVQLHCLLWPCKISLMWLGCVMAELARQARNWTRCKMSCTLHLRHFHCRICPEFDYVKTYLFLELEATITIRIPYFGQNCRTEWGWDIQWTPLTLANFFIKHVCVSVKLKMVHYGTEMRRF